jgi:hypothetical protein
VTSSAGHPPSEWPLHARVIRMRRADFPEPRFSGMIAFQNAFQSWSEEAGSDILPRPP